MMAENYCKFIVE